MTRSKELERSEKEVEVRKDLWVRICVAGDLKIMRGWEGFFRKFISRILSHIFTVRPQ
jgi:hypothetical protein